MRRLSLLIALALSAGAAQAQTVATDPWVRATVPGQQATGLFVELKSPTAARLVGGTSPVAASVEVHEMRMDGGVMRMRALSGLDLPAGQAVSLRPGSYHIMLMGLRSAVKAGDTVPVTLTIERAGKTETLQLQAPARAGQAMH
ncbi:copper chaperone PCu(A)C [Roseateles cellulosilyticus]|uniref:Copper chaperone PCu(A)C n=1 Tax=Pelomonas cellulosilytica TaxID=2906762 RepID=A0ABS8Y355_9BURK|nr:copper chaperone PCu(A)C [Pelomonas sp. P8]MCE4558160.1 copper chaperone PCu(A)C [Pelomonas sp. P8]